MAVVHRVAGLLSDHAARRMGRLPSRVARRLLHWVSMPLEAYRKKRDFGKTQEPKPVVPRKRGFSFVVQKHAARRLHYDFRLELDGVLLSWAVPKGPSLDPGVKRLAMHVEDHPVAYRDFEGIIPEGEYGGGTVMVWDTGTWEPEGDPRAAYQKGRLTFRLAGQKLHGKWHLVRTHRDEGKDAGKSWLLFKGTDAAADPKHPDITELQPRSAATGRDLDEIAAARDRIWHSDRETVPKTPPPPSPAPSLDAIVRGLAPTVRFSNLDKVLYPEQGITKAALAAYYAVVAERMLPHLRGRPVTLVRCPDGAGKDCFFQKQFKAGVPGAIHRVDVAEPGGKPEIYMEIHDVEGLLAAAQLGSLELHVWGSRMDALERPDQLVFDLDPDPSVAWPDVVQASVDLRDLLEKLALKSWVKTTGGKGLHVVVPVAPEVEWPQAKDFTESVAEVMVRLHPGRFTTNIAKAARPRKIFIDYLRNGRGATAIAPYSTRSHPGAPVATPVTWEELARGVRPDAFDLATVPRRIEASRRDPWHGFLESEQSLEKALKKIERGY